MNKSLRLSVVLSVPLFVTGCWKPYDAPEYVDVDTAETAFVVPLEGDTGDQVKFQSEKYLQDHEVATKRIQVTHRWNQTGYYDTDGGWIANVKVIKILRSPVTREWTADKTTGTGTKDEAIWVESADSVGFSMGFTCTGYIKEEDSAKFLYWYPSGSLAQVMDSEVRARVQQNVSAVAAKYPLDTLRSKKGEIIDAVRTDIIPFFADRGITISTVANFGGMTYENPDIQKAIDNVFIAQQQKDVNEAAFDAQQKANDRITLEATATADKARTIARGLADAKVIEAKGESDALLLKAQAIKAAGPGLFELRQLEIEQARVEKWNGNYPVTYFGSPMNGSAPNLLLNMLQATTQP